MLKKRLLGESTSGDVLNKLTPILQVPSVKTPSYEIIELFAGRKNPCGAPPPTSVVSIADIQKIIQAFSHQCILDNIPCCWNFTQAGDEPVSSDNKCFELKGITGESIRGEAKIMTFETMFNKFMVRRLHSTRVARDYVRRLEWSIMVWTHSQFSGMLSGRSCAAVVDSLPRGIMEHEKCMMFVYSHLFNLPIGTQLLDNYLPPDSIDGSTIESRIFLDIYLKLFSSLQVLHY